MSKKVKITAMLVGAFVLSGLASSTALAAPAAVQGDAAVPAPGPMDLTWADVSAVPFESATFSPQVRSRIAAVCNLNTGPIYFRTSASNLPYGGIGIKPVTTCNTPMSSISHTVNIYKTVWWGLQWITGASNSSYGVSSLTTRSVQIDCADTRTTTFRAIVSSSAVTLTGASSGASAYEEATLDCGTNP